MGATYRRSLWGALADPRGTLAAQTVKQETVIVRPVQPQDQKAAYELWMQGFRDFFWIYWTGAKPEVKKLEWRKGLLGIWETVSTAVLATIWPLVARFNYYMSLRMLNKFAPKGDMANVHANWAAPDVGRHFFVATTSDGELVGTAGLRVSVPPSLLPPDVCQEEERKAKAWQFIKLELGEGEVLRMSVSNKYRRLGIGSKLIQAIEAQAKASGVKKLMLSTASEPAAKFYSSCGYESKLTRTPDGKFLVHRFSKPLVAPQWEELVDSP